MRQQHLLLHSTLATRSCTGFFIFSLAKSAIEKRCAMFSIVVVVVLSLLDQVQVHANYYGDYGQAPPWLTWPSWGYQPIRTIPHNITQNFRPKPPSGSVGFRPPSVSNRPIPTTTTSRPTTSSAPQTIKTSHNK